MMWKTVLLLILPSFVHIYCQDEEDAAASEDIGREYIDVYKTAPTIMEYLINILQDKHETLQKDDVTVLTNDVKSLSEPSLLEYDVDRVKDIYVRIAPVARVTSEDVMKQVLKVQQKLEENNTQRRRVSKST